MAPKSARRLLDALQAWAGVIAVVGAGGKKTTLLRLIEAHRELGTTRLALTCTVPMTPPPEETAPLVLHPPGAPPARMPERGFVIYASPSDKPRRLGGVPRSWIRPLHGAGGFAVTLVKADGARMRAIKAPARHEPALPEAPDVVVPVVSAHAFGSPLDTRIAHRPEQLGEVLDLPPGGLITPAHVARLLTCPEGSLKGTEDAGKVVPVINMVDDSPHRHAARVAARLALAQTTRFGCVVLAQMTSSRPVIEIIQS